MSPPSPEQLAARLEDLEKGDSEVRAFLIERNRRQRVSGDLELLSDIEPSPLLGSLIGVKDIINVEGLPTRAGSDLPSELFAGPEARVVSRLKKHGALVAGKTTTTEFAFSEPPPTRNPRNGSHTPGGSSSGSAAAVGAGLVQLAIGTQTVDSIVTPAAYCGVVGFKPTYRRIPVAGVLPCSPSMDHVGFLTDTVNTAMIGAAATFDEWSREDVDHTPIVLAVPGPGYLRKVERESLGHFAETLKRLRGQGVRVVETDALEDIDQLVRAHRRLNAAEFAKVHWQWHARYGDRYRPRTAAFFAEGRDLPDSAVDEGRSSGRELRDRLTEILDRGGISAWVAPSATGPAPEGLDYIGDPTMSIPWTHAHLPVVALPTGEDSNGLPLGIQLVGRHDGDEGLLALASTVEAGITG